jgi:HSP20 family protein
LSRPARQDPFSQLLAEFSERLEGGRFRPAVDVYETEKEIVVQVELAGVRREDVRVTVDGDLLRIRGARAPARDESIQRLHQVEIVAGPFERALRIGLPFESGSVRASIEDGLLRVRLPKRLPAPRRRIDVEG